MRLLVKELLMGKQEIKEDENKHSKVIDATWHIHELGK
tara:strand:- start:96 stop:209 length:114 start_codon:yes stop_codon:yes gene_type:complete